MIADDPIFALIERHRGAARVFSAAFSDKDKVQAAHWPWSDAPERMRSMMPPAMHGMMRLRTCYRPSRRRLPALLRFSIMSTSLRGARSTTTKKRFW
jgi:hypothetical protein